MVNEEILLQVYNLKVEGKVIFQSDSKLILSGVSREFGDIPVALKFSRLDTDLIDPYISQFLISNIKRHPNVLNHYAIHRLDRTLFDFDLFEVLELVNNQELSEIFIQEISTILLKRMILKLLEGFLFCHEKGILHRDVKPSNIMSCKNKEGYGFKIIDFEMMGNSENKRLFTTPRFLAPEVLSFTDYTVKSEIWSIGLILYLLFAKDLPFDTRETQLSIIGVKQNVLNAEFDFSKVPSPLRIPLSLCLKKNPDERIGNLGLLIFIIDPIYFLKSRFTKILSKS